MKKLFILLLLSIGLLCTQIPRTYAALDINYSYPFIFAYNDHVYIIISSDNTGPAPLIGMNLTTYDNEFYVSWDGAELTAADYTEITNAAKEAVFIGSYGSSQGSDYTEYYRLFELHGGGSLVTLTGVTDTMIIQMNLTPQYVVIASGGVFESMTLRQFFDLQEKGYYGGYTSGYEDGEIDGIVSGYADGFGDGVADQADEITDAYDAGIAVGAASADMEIYQAGYDAGIAHEANDFYDDIETWLVPAIIVVIFFGGIMSIIAIRKRQEL